jgi:hypothetical protein
MYFGTGKTSLMEKPKTKNLVSCNTAPLGAFRVFLWWWFHLTSVMEPKLFLFVSGAGFLKFWPKNSLRLEPVSITVAEN